jgi:hypothetical protein
VRSRGPKGERSRPFISIVGGTKTVCDGFGKKRSEKEGFVGVLVVSPKGFGPDAGKKQKPIKECDSSGWALA